MNFIWCYAPFLKTKKKMSWNHRVLAHKDGDEMYLQIHEVYYDKDGKPNGYTANGVSVGLSLIHI